MTYEVRYETKEGQYFKANFIKKEDAEEFRNVRREKHPELACSQIKEMI